MNSSPSYTVTALPLVPCAPVSGRILLWSFLAGLAITLPVLWVISFLPLPELTAGMAQARALQMGVLYVRPGLPAMICHAAINLLVVFVVRPLADSGAFAPQFGQLALPLESWIVLAVSGALFATGWRLLRAEFPGSQRNLAA